MKYLLPCMLLLVSCNSESDSEVNVSLIESSGELSVRADVWADNWFEFSLGEQAIIEDSVSITTERSFNAESFSFNASYPLQLNFVLKDFKEDDTGLEYIGQRNQQMGDGGFIAQFFDNDSGELIATSQSNWKCLVIHEAPLDKSCEASSNPVVDTAPCGFDSLEEPPQWKSISFDDSNWENATEHSNAAVDPKGGYDALDWHADAKLIWSADLETHNTLLCRTTVSP